MATKKITELTNETNPTANDVLPIVDIETLTTKKVSLTNLWNFIKTLGINVANITGLSAVATSGSYSDLSNKPSTSIASANGFSGSVADPNTNPAITISTPISGILKGNGTAISSATAGTDYENPLTVAPRLERTVNELDVKLSSDFGNILEKRQNGLYGIDTSATSDFLIEAKSSPNSLFRLDTLKDATTNNIAYPYSSRRVNNYIFIYNGFNFTLDVFSVDSNNNLTFIYSITTSSFQDFITTPDANHIYVVQGGGLMYFNATDKTPTQTRKTLSSTGISISVSSYAPMAIDVSRNVLFIAGTGANLYSINITTRNAPTLLLNYTGGYSSTNKSEMYLNGVYLYIAVANEARLLVVNTTTLTALNQTQNITFTGAFQNIRFCSRLIATNKLIFLGSSQYHVFDISSATLPSLLKYNNTFTGGTAISSYQNNTDIWSDTVSVDNVFRFRCLDANNYYYIKEFSIDATTGNPTYIREIQFYTNRYLYFFNPTIHIGSNIYIGFGGTGNSADDYNYATAVISDTLYNFYVKVGSFFKKVF